MEESDQQSGYIAPINKNTSELLIKRENNSDIEVYKEVLNNKFTKASTVEECEKLLKLRQKVHLLDSESRQLNYAEESAQSQLQQTRQESKNQQIQQNIAMVFSVGFGVYLLHEFSFAGLLLVILGLTKPLGYSLNEIGGFIDNLKDLSIKSSEFMINKKNKMGEDEDANS